MSQPLYGLDSDSRAVVMQALKEVCPHCGWNLLAAHVRSNHVHVIVEAQVPPEKVTNDIKACASRRRWARHGSTLWLWNDQDVREAIRYVVEEQGEAMAVFLGDVP